MGLRYEQVINRLIPADDLHYDASQRRYASISPAEVEEIIVQCRQNGLTDDALIEKYVRWCGVVRVSQILCRLFRNGSLQITGFVGNEPQFAPRERTP
jgi:hypothetical protein